MFISSQAAELVERLREVCVTHELPAVFNALLCALYGRCGVVRGG
jgi:hypothetical protein